MNQAEARAFVALAGVLNGTSPADDSGAVSAARYLAKRTQAALRSGTAVRVERAPGVLGPAPVPEGDDDLSTSTREAYAERYPAEEGTPR